METKTKIIIGVAIAAVIAVVGLIVVPNVMRLTSGEDSSASDRSNAVAASAASYWSMGDPYDGRIKAENIEGLDKVKLKTDEITKLEDFLTKRFSSEKLLDEYKLLIEEKESPEADYRLFRLVDKQTNIDYMLELGEVWTIERGYDASYAQLLKDVEAEKKKAEQQKAAEEEAAAAIQAAELNPTNGSNRNSGSTSNSNNTNSNTETAQVDTAGTVQLSSDSVKNVLPESVRNTLLSDLDSALKANGNSVKKAEDVYVVTNSVSVQDTLCKFAVRVNTANGPMTINCTYDTSTDRHSFTGGN